MAAPPAHWLPAFLKFCSVITINSKNHGRVPLRINGAQRRFLAELHGALERDVHESVALKARQLGMSTIMLALDLFWLFMFEGLQGALVYDTAKNTQQARLLLTDMLESLPDEWAIPVALHNRDTLVLANGSSLQYLSAGKGKNSGLGRSRALNFVHASEISSWGDQDGIESLKAALSDEHPNRLFIFESTALGHNVFFDMYEEAKADPAKHAFFVAWWALESYSISRDDPLFEHYWLSQPELTEDEAITQHTVAEQYGHDITPEQWAWYRHKSGGELTPSFLQEFPSCVSGDTLVGTDAGIMRIDQIRPGAVTALGPVLAQGPTGRAPMYVLKTHMGYELRGTADHPMAMVDGKFVGIAESAGRRVRLQPPRFAKEPFVARWKEGPIEHAIEITPNLARFLGYFMGDGCITRRKGQNGAQLSIACDGQDADVVEDVCDLIREVFGVEPYTRAVGSKKGGVEVRAYSLPIYQTLKALGCIQNDTGPTKRWVRVPPCILRSPRGVVREFLTGLFEADGHAKANGFGASLFSKSADFLREVQLLLLGFGITCRRSSYETSTASNGQRHAYTARSLDLRLNEAIAFHDKIGFAGARKQARMSLRKKPTGNGRQPFDLVLEDVVTSVEPDGEDEAWNLSVGKTKLFDAFGLLTHNTEAEAWQSSGHSFFPSMRITADLSFLYQAGAKAGFLGFKYTFGRKFTDLVCQPVDSVDDVELRVWEQPRVGGKYVIGMDVAYGREAENDRTVISIWRCYADKLVQVAEYATPEPTEREATWVLAHLAGCYKDSIVNVEVNGPGGAVMNEMRNLKDSIHAGQFKDVGAQFDPQWALDQARWFLYSRVDAIGANYVFNTITSERIKELYCSGFRDGYKFEEILVRSIPLLHEMSKFVRNNGRLEASGRNKDDRVMASCFAWAAWSEHVRSGMRAMGMDYALVTRAEQETAHGALNVTEWIFRTSQSEWVEDQARAFDHQRRLLEI